MNFLAIAAKNQLRKFMITLDTPVEQVPKIGSAYQKKLKKLKIETVRDLLFYFPNRYDDFSNIVPIKKAQLGYEVCIQGRITEIKLSRSFKKWMEIVEIEIEDETGSIRAVWFNQPYLGKSLKEGEFMCLAGKVSLGKSGIYLNNPAYEKISEISENQNLTHTGRIIPVYAETRGLTSRWLRYIIKPLLAYFYNQVPDILPEEISKKQKFLPIQEAIRQVHFPDSFEEADAAKARFAFEELLLLQLSVLKEKAKLVLRKAPACPMNADLMKEFTSSLPFQLTDSQRQASFQILKDLERSIPMSRLLEGDVGSGKTVVVTMSALNTAKCGYQVAFMAPTEILAKQHFKSVSNLLKDFKVSIGLVTGKEASIFRDGRAFEVKKDTFLEDLKNGQIDIAIGTHSLIQKDVEFKNLALVILDEQHRFGVNQRAELMQGKKLVPHLLSMTATPIPRTLALTVYGDLDLSLITEMPKNRKKIKTFTVGPKDRQKAYEFIRDEVKAGKGVFVICPRIEQSEATKTSLWSDVKTVKDEYEKLSGTVFPDLNIGMLHGKLKPKEKELIMNDFRDGQIDILISTSVVEVGVDVPRATVMMIEGAERFGLSQLHQFRGRVGRSDLQSYCFLFTTSPDQLVRKRLKVMETSDSGFELAQKDLEIRGPGQLYGSQQWGLPDMAMAGLSNIFLVEKTRAAAQEILEKDPELKNHPLLVERMKQFETKIHFE